MSYIPENYTTHFEQTIRVEVNLSKEDRKLLEDLMGTVAMLTSVIGSAQPVAVQEKIIEEITEPKTTETPAPAADPVEETPALVAEPESEAKPIALAEFQKAVTLAVSKGAEAKKAAKEIINKYAASVSAVPEDKRAEVMAELANI